MRNCLKNGKFILCIILAILTAIMLPIEVFAQVAPKHNPSAIVKFDSLAESEDIGEIVTELKERRDEYTKHFRMEDGTMMAVTYDVPVHYKNKKGKWIEYDNSLGSESTASPDEASQIFYSNKKSKLDIDLASKADKDNLVSINSSKGDVSWKYLDANNSNIKVEKNKKKEIGNERYISLNKLSSKASYKNIYNKVNLECVISTAGVKENIILKDNSAKNEFDIEYSIKGFHVKQENNQTVNLYKGKKEVYSITAPCMYDSDKRISKDVSLKIVNKKADKLILKLTADKGFLNKAKYPVTIDPEIVLSGYDNTMSTCINANSPNYIHYSSTEFYVGTNGADNYSGLLKLKNIGDNYQNKNIVSAKVNLFPYTYSSEMEIEAYPVTSSWEMTTATYSNVTYDNEIIDYVTTKADSAQKVTLDITKCMKKWVNGSLDNNGIILKSNDAYTEFAGYVNYRPSKRPVFEIKYKEYTGLESNLTSHSVPCGQDSVFSVCDYTGSLSVKQVFFEENTARLPLSLYATYHSLRNSSDEMGGCGWHNSFNQIVTEDDNYYIYTDADGVYRYFKKEDNFTELSDEEDLYTLKLNDSKIKIDNGEITKTFEIVDNTETYKLKREESNDNSDNKIQYFYNNAGYMNKITTSLGDYTIARSSENVICWIQTPSGKQMTPVYYSNSSKLAYFTAIDGKSTRFNYTTLNSEGLLREAFYANGNNTYKRIVCTYYSNNKVKDITEYGKSGASRKALSVTYNDDNTTEFKEMANNNKKETYTFDNYGNTVSVLNANGMITNANDSGSLAINTGADSYTKNYITESNEPNSIGNGQYFNKCAGDLENHTAVEGNASIDNTVSYMGNKSIKIENEANTHNATAVYHTLSASGFVGEDITLSSYVRIGGSEKIYNDLSCGAYVSVECLNSSGNANSSAISDSISVAKTVNGWDRISASINVPEGTANIRVKLGLNNTYGTAWFDCVQLEKSKVMNDYNALPNSDFSSSSVWKTQDDNAVTANNGEVEITGCGGEPAPTEETASSEPDTTSAIEATAATYTRTETETVANDVVEETNAYGNVIKTEQGFVTRTYERTYEVAEPETEPASQEISSGDEAQETETINSNRFIYQEIDVNKKDVSFVISGSARAKSVPLNNEYRTFGIALKIKYEDDEDYSEDHYQEFNAYTDAMQSVSLSVTPNDSEKIVEKIAFAFVYGYNKNKMTVKNAMLNYAYNGSASEAVTEPEPTSATEPETTAPAEPESTAAENEDILIDEQIVTESVNTDEDYMRTQKTYDSNGNYVTSEIDEAGNTTSYTNDADGNVTQITDGRGNSISYSYDVHNNLTSVSHGDVENTYTYNDYNELYTLGHNGYFYRYIYDDFGNKTGFRICDYQAVTYTYDDNDNLTKVKDGNYDITDYIYDSYARLTEVKINDTTLATYIYNKKGQITKFVDGKSGETTEYCYDCHGNALYKYLVSSDGELLRVVDGDTEKTAVNGSMRTITSGTDEDGNSYVKNGKAKITTDTDDFGRTTKVTTKVDDSPKLNVNYTYKKVGETNRTTNNVQELTYKLGNDNELIKYKYSYDANGNITDVWENNVKTAEYTYNSLNELTKVKDYVLNKQTEYTYDNGGNKTKNSERALDPATGEPTGTAEEKTFTYNPGGIVEDTLRYIDDFRVRYDNICNPTSYRDGMSMTWTCCELQNITKDNDTYSYSYNINGLRTKKSVNGNNTFYYYDDSNNLIGLKKGNTTVLFYYDSEGQLYSMSKGNDTYFFVKTLQGDITKIIDENGTTAATYAYDAWGKILSENENSAIEGLNPFRYRGYVYDPETELYYLQSRYYDPITGRFLNLDNPEFSDTGSGTPLSTNMFAYCENNAVNYVDENGTRTFFLNGINNDSKKNPKYAIKFKNALTKVKGVVLIPIFKSKGGFSGIVDGIIKVIKETFNINAFTNHVVKIIKKSLKDKPLSKGEQLNLIGYSGGGQVALNVMEKLKNKFNNVVLIGAPVNKTWKSTTKVSIIWAMYDPLSWVVGSGFKSYFAGWFGHTDYFNKTNIKTVAKIVMGIIK